MVLAMWHHGADREAICGKEVGASGQISLGEKYAGRRFNVIAHPGDRFEFIPLGEDVAELRDAGSVVRSPDGWIPPGGYDVCNQWALDNREALEQYARQIEEEGTAAEQLQRYIAELPGMPTDTDGKI